MTFRVPHTFGIALVSYEVWHWLKEGYQEAAMQTRNCRRARQREVISPSELSVVRSEKWSDQKGNDSKSQVVDSSQGSQAQFR